MDIETLQLENEKLNARLQKAIQVFSEQKTTIQNLNDENALLKNKLAEAESKARSAEDDAKFFEQVSEIDNLTKALNDTKIELESITAKANQLAADNDALQAKFEEVSGNCDNFARVLQQISETLNSLKQ